MTPRRRPLHGPDAGAREPSDAARRAAPSDAPAHALTHVDAIRALQRTVGNRATARLLGGGTPAGDPVGRLGVRRKPAAVVQRVLQVNGKNVNLGMLLDHADDMNESVILANWDWSKTVHNFEATTRQEAYAKLYQAIGAAKSQVVDPPALYVAANLKFLTNASGRLPTLYFISGSLSGRIRQQHGSGPAGISQSGKVDYFFANHDKLQQFQQAAQLARSEGKDFTTDVGTYAGSLNPTAGNYHLEITYSGSKPGKTHASGGLINVSTGDYDDLKIKAIYQKAIGFTT